MAAFTASDFSSVLMAASRFDFRLCGLEGTSPSAATERRWQEMHHRRQPALLPAVPPVALRLELPVWLV